MARQGRISAVKIIAAQEGIRDYRVRPIKHGLYYCGAHKVAYNSHNSLLLLSVSQPFAFLFLFVSPPVDGEGGGEGREKSLWSLLWLAKTRPSISIQPQRDQIDRTESAARPARAMSIKFDSHSISAFGAPQSFSALLPPLVVEIIRS